MARGLETKFTKCFTDSLNARGHYAYKIPDTPPSSGLRFTTKKPYDVVASIGGRFVAIEVKLITKYKAFGMRDLRPNQIEGLEAALNSKGAAFVLLNVRIAGDALEGVKRVNEAILFNYIDLKAKGSYGHKEVKELQSFKFYKDDYIGLCDYLEVIT